MAKTELTPGYYNDPYAEYGDIATGIQFPLEVYDDTDLVTYEAMIGSGSLANTTVVTLHSVGSQPVPIRWLGLIVQTAQALEVLQKHGIKPPKNWKLMAPIHLNAASNNLDPQDGVEQAQRLARLAQDYVAQFHPDLTVKPELELDNAAASQALIAWGYEMAHQLPDTVLQQLSHMSGNRSDEFDPDEAIRKAAGYLLGHYNAYGYTEQGGFSNRQQGSLFIVPQSEIKFFNMMESAQEVVTAAGIPVITPQDSNTARLLSPMIRTPHYYGHKGEPLLQQIRNVQDWNRSRNLGNQGINGRALDEIREVIALIDADVTKARIPELVELIKGTL
ncbi:MAG: hypothetical protein WBO77_01665 [Microgenomates group bacterium]